MEKILDIITHKMQAAFEAAGYDRSYGRVTVSNRPDLCEYQCNGALAAAKQYHCAPIQIAKAVVAQLNAQDYSLVEAVNPGFINLKLSGHFLMAYLEEMRTAPKFGVDQPGEGKTVVVDYGGANVAKPLHIGHLRPAIIGESLKRLYKYLGYNAIGDVHLGDWGLQMGLIIAELSERQPDLPYFDPNFEGEYPKEAPFTVTDLEEIYPTASAKKADPEFSHKAHQATLELQQGRRGYRALWQHIMNVSVADLKKNYDNLDVDFEKWLGESDADPYIPAMVEDMKARGIAVQSEGAWVIPVALEGDKKEMPPCILVKSDGSSIYATTDLATLVQRMQDWHPDKVLYVTDKRQNLHFEQVFRAARKAGIVPETTELEHVKYGDLSNQPTKDYNFDMERFAAFEGNTGPYILYTIVRIKSILSRYGAWENLPIQEPANDFAKDLMLSVTKLGPTLEQALKTSSPNLVCAYIYELAGCVNKFYHETRILSEEDEKLKAGYIALIGLAKNILETCIYILGFSAPEKM